MNQDQVKGKLLSLKIPCPEFSLVFSGKASARVNGLYKPAEALIVIHNKNFTDNDNALMYTALHELTHHVAGTRGLVTGRNAHPVLFWALFHSILKLATDAGIYTDPFETDPELKAKGDAILDLLRQQNELELKLAAAMGEMTTLAGEKGARMEDYLDRHARIPRGKYHNLLRTPSCPQALGGSAAVSPALVDAVVGCREQGTKAAEMAAAGCSIQQIKAVCRQKKIIDPMSDPGEEETEENKLERLERKLAADVKKKQRLEIHIAGLTLEIDTLKGQLSLDFDKTGTEADSAVKLSA